MGLVSIWLGVVVGSSGKGKGMGGAPRRQDRGLRDPIKNMKDSSLSVTFTRTQIEGNEFEWNTLSKYNNTPRHLVGKRNDRHHQRHNTCVCYIIGRTASTSVKTSVIFVPTTRVRRPLFAQGPMSILLVEAI